ncbi:amidohydrolase family protein [Montanilutibacter psychrotolerans]|uniref:Amidohydrolase n=1 Tax=Montanilutibacter psychrotolerans TaxID=1327343 RepID=A0A3M8SNQ6_9GAMM|nr:amidohydrolase family protein [Lysobacter psychrotolerans]RNF82869.1 amidohydrolase [Lysobacter psychrotolerans]
MTPNQRLLSVALASALSLYASAAALAQQPPPQPAPTPAPAEKDEPVGDKPAVQLEQDALDPAGNDPARASVETAKGKGKPGEDGKPPAWDVTAAHGPVRTVRFDTDEGTWMDVDVSPDGRELVFSLLGDIYRLPATGGTARRVTTGPAWDVQPRYSPDGRELAFTSDRGGGNNLWRIGIDGGNASQVTKETFRLLNNPAWTPDGQYIIGRKHFTGERSLGAGELWMYHVSGGEGLQLTTQKNDQQDLGEPAVSPDGRYVYFSEDVTAGPFFQYNKNPHDVIYAIKRLDRETGRIDEIVSTPGGAVRPQPSPDGKSLAFVKRVREKSVLHVLDLASGAVRPVWDGLSHDQQEAWAIFGPYTNFDWTPDSGSVVVWAQGKLWRIDMASGTARDDVATQIPFTAGVEQSVTQPLRFAQTIDEGTFTPKMIRDVATSADGSTLVFHAVGQLWRKRLPDGAPERLTGSQGAYEYQPSFSADGRKLLYTSWSDEAMGAIHVRDANGSGAGRRLTTEKGFYYGPRFSPDGSRIVYSRTGGGGLTGSLWSVDRGIYVIPANGGTPVRVAEDGAAPQFSADGQRVYFLTGDGLKKKLMSVGLNGESPREVFDLKYVDGVSISPDGKWVAFTELFNAYVAPMMTTGKAVELSKDSKAIPVTQVSADIGSYLHWGADSTSLHWMVGDRYHSRDLNQSFAFLPGAPKVLPKPVNGGGIAVGLSVPVDRPSEVVAFTHARIVTMRDAENGEEVIEDGTLVVRGDVIEALGTGIAIPAGARVIDASGKTIVPGYVDAHAHASHFGRGVVPQQNWAYYTNLAFGVTTMHDPSATTEFVFSEAELQKAGRMVGPRVFSTGTILYGADGDFKAVVDSLDDARSHLRRMKANGAFSVKSYNQPRREQRQQINTAARELGMLVVEEGGSTFHHNMTMVLDGVTSIEHNLPVAPLYKDVIGLWSQTDVRNTPTLVVSYGGLSGEYWWYARDNVWEDRKLNRFFPRETLDARSIRRETAPDWDYYHVEVAKAAKTLRDAGVKIQVGGHGQLQGLSPNWEIWSLVQGGFSNFEALRAATFDGADMLGLGRQIGSLEAGKQADLVVLNSNPLENIRATIDTRYVMVDGRLFDVDADMAELGNQRTPSPQFYWQRHRDGQTFGTEFGPTAVCHCPKGHGAHVHLD